MLPLNTPVSELNRIGKVLTKRLSRLGVSTIKDLLFYLPFRFEDFSGNNNIVDLTVGTTATIKGSIESAITRRTRRRNLTMTEVLIADTTGVLKIVFFNQPYLQETFKIGKEFYFSGKVKENRGTITLASPSYETVKQEDAQLHTARLLPVYPSTESLTQKQLRFLIDQALESVSLIQDWLPEEFKAKRELCSLKEAIIKIHRPETEEDIEIASKRLEYDNFFMIQSKACYVKQALKNFESPSLQFKEKQIKALVASLPFELTNDQKKVTWKILQEIEREIPMNRLVQGDVGSGKTIVAFLAMYQCFLANYQATLMAPTEILAKQHYQGALKLFSEMKIPIMLLTSKTKRIYLPGENLLGNDEKVSPKKALELIESGAVKFIIGTHSVISEKVNFNNLALAVIDEQHRFGVKQRGALRNKLSSKKISPHYLSMTATPIPRTQALFLFGDLDVSVISQMPKGRKTIITQVVEVTNRQTSYDFMKSQVEEGRQCFVICPLIDASDTLGVTSVTETYQYLKESVFPNLKIEVLHGKLKTAEKDAIMADFKNKKFDILVSTSVVEVGVDIPNATIMLIEGAERFGLSQLHQFRGRVGRGEHQSYCFLATSESTEATNRLKSLESVSNGLELARIDLKFRGPGQVYGTAQSGVVDINIGGKQTSLFDNVDFIEQIRDDIFTILEQNKATGEHAKIIEKIKESSAGIYLE